jgi:GDP-L-fucose synthase
MKNDALLVVGHGDVVETSLVQHLRAQDFTNIISSTERALDVLNRAAVDQFFQKEKPRRVVLTSVRSGGIGANRAYPAEFIFENAAAQTNVIDAAYKNGVEKLLYLAASCIYPKDAPQPIREEYFMAGPMEPTSEPYSMAKAAGVVMCEAYRAQYGFNAIVGVPATVYGPGGREAEADAHVLASMAAKLRAAKASGAASVTFWGTGTPRREFIHGQDLASGCLFLLEHYDGAGMVNIGTGGDVAIAELAAILKEASGFKGEIIWDRSRPDGAMRKLLDNSRITAMGWKPGVSLKQGIGSMFDTVRGS